MWINNLSKATEQYNQKIYSNVQFFTISLFRPSSSGSEGKESACNAGDLDLMPGQGRSPGEGNGYPLQYSCTENFMDRGYSPWSCKELHMTE